MASPSTQIKPTSSYSALHTERRLTSEDSYTYFHQKCRWHLIPLSGNITILSVTLDDTLSFNNYVSNISKSCYYHIRVLRSPSHPPFNHRRCLQDDRLLNGRLSLGLRKFRVHRHFDLGSTQARANPEHTGSSSNSSKWPI